MNVCKHDLLNSDDAQTYFVYFFSGDDKNMIMSDVKDFDIKEMSGNSSVYDIFDDTKQHLIPLSSKQHNPTPRKSHKKSHKKKNSSPPPPLSPLSSGDLFFPDNGKSKKKKIFKKKLHCAFF